MRRSLAMETNHKWVSIDPGSHIGIAFWMGAERVETRCWHVGKLWHDVIAGCREPAVEVQKWVGIVGTVVMEDFLLRGRVGSTDREGLSPVQVAFTMLTMWLEWGWKGDCVMQLPGEAMGVITDVRLEAKGMYDGNAHEKDATRHGLLYIRKHPVR